MGKMMSEVNEVLDKLKIEAYNNEYYWRARDIQFLLENCTWDKLQTAIIRIKKNCEKQNLDITRDIIPTTTTINDGQSRHVVEDFYLSNIMTYQIFYQFNEANKKIKFSKFKSKKKLKKYTEPTSNLTLKHYILSIFVSLIVVCAITVLSIFYIPLKPLQYFRDLYISTAMTTYTHQWLATWFFSEETINDVMSKVPKDFDENSNSINFYVDKDSIEVYEVSDTTYSGKLLKISNPSKVKIALSSQYGTIGEFLQKIVENNNAVAGINASGFVDPEGHGKAAYPVGILIKDGKIIYDPGYEIYDVVGFDKADNLIVGRYTMEEIKKLNLRDAVEPFYRLTVNGKNRISEGNGGYGLHPRTAIGQTAKGEVLLLVIDGRQLHSVGATMKDCQDILVTYGAINSAALDGGSSSIMYYDGAIQTKPSNGTTYGRYLPSAWVVYE